MVLKATDKKEVEFELVSEDYYFVGWSAVEKSAPQKDASLFVDIKVTDEDNKYKTAITLLNNSPDLLLTPVTKLKPAVQNAKPEYYPSGVSFFKVVTLTFTQPMKKTDLESWRHIGITDKNGNSLKDCFHTPELSEDGKVLIIVPYFDKLKGFLTNVETFQIKVSVDGDLSDAENSPYKTKPFTHSYVINKPVDDAPPVLTEINVFKEILNLETREKTLVPVNENVFDENWSDDELEHHHIGESIFINCKGTDNSSGIKALQVTETYLKDTNGQDGSGTVSGNYGTFIEKTENIFETDTFEYVLQAKNNGVIKLDFELIGYNGKVSGKKTFYVVRDMQSGGVIYSCNLRKENCSVNEKQLNWNSSLKIGLRCFCFYKEHYEPRYVNIQYWDEADEDNIKTLVSGYTFTPDKDTIVVDFNDITFVRNSQKDTIVKVTVETKYGSFYEEFYKLDKSVDFYIKKSEIIAPSALDLFFNPDIPTKAKITFEQSASCKSKYFYYQKKANKEDIYAGDLISANGISSSEITLDPGYYKVYFEYKSEGDFLVFSDSVIEFQVTDEGKVLSLQGEKSVNDSDWPVISNKSVTESGPNSEICNVKYDYSFTGNPEYIFRLNFVQKDLFNGYRYFDKEISVENMSETFILDSGYRYEPYFSCYDKSGVLLSDSREKNIDYSAHNIDLREVHNLIPEFEGISISGGFESSPVNAIFKVPSFFDDPSVQQKITYYVVKNKQSFAVMDYSEDLVKDLPEYTFENGTDFIAASAQTQIPVEVTENDYYTIFAKLFDEYGNYSISKSFFSSYVSGEIDLSKISVSENTITMPDEKALGAYSYYYDGNGWNQGEGVSSSENENQNFTLTVTDAYKDKFVKIVSFSPAKTNVPSYKMEAFRNYNKTVYLCPDYFISDRKIKNKGMMELKNGYQLFIDQPAFVRVLYSKTNWGDDADLWGTRGFETDCRVENETFTYTPNIREVPSGYYYCTVVHFADGTSVMGTVLKKP